METIATESRTTWITKPIGDVLDVVTGNTPSKKESANDGDFMPFIKPPELQNGLIGQASEALSELGARSARVVPSGSVLISCIGNLGRVGLTDRPIAFNQQINAIKPHPDVVAKYLFYYFQGPLFRQALERASTATTVALVNKGNFEMTRPDPGLRKSGPHAGQKRKSGRKAPQIRYGLQADGDQRVPKRPLDHGTTTTAVRLGGQELYSRMDGADGLVPWASSG